MRYKQICVVEKEGGSGTETITTLYIGKHFEVEQRDSFTNYRHFISDVAIVDLYDNKPSQIAFTHRDRLGSTVTMTDHNDNTTSLRHFDPFGKPRGGDWSLLDSDISIATNRLQDNLQDQRSDIRRGFTDHEHLDEAELIHMNGRVYDYNVGRFLSVDPVLHVEKGSQGINPYSYIYNNPLSGTDPTGYKASEEEKETVKIEATVTTTETKRVSVTGSRIKKKVATSQSVSGTVTSSNGVTTAIEGTISNGKFEGNFTTSVGKSSLSAKISMDIGSQQSVASETQYNPASKVNTEYGLTIPVDDGLTAQTVLPGPIPLPIPIPKSPEQIKREKDLAKQFTDLLSDVLKGKVDSEDKIRVFRVETSVNQRVFITSTGEVALFGNAMLWINFGDRARAEVFLKQRQEQGFASASIKSFEIPESFANAIISMAVPQSESRRFPNAPQIGDPTKADNQIGLRKHHIDQLQMVIHQGSGRVEN